MSDLQFAKNEKRTLFVVFLTAIAMVVEIAAGMITGSMALLADGIHMGSHVLAIGLSWIAYYLIRKAGKNPGIKLEKQKVLSLAAYTSGLILLVFAVFIIVEAVDRFIDPVVILYREAIFIAVAGLVVNIVSAFILHGGHHDEDHNIKAAYLHVLADALTSIAAISGLLAGLLWNIPYVDQFAAFISSGIIIRWSLGLLKNAAGNLINLTKSG